MDLFGIRETISFFRDNVVDAVEKFTINQIVIGSLINI